MGNIMIKKMTTISTFKNKSLSMVKNFWTINPIHIVKIANRKSPRLLFLYDTSLYTTITPIIFISVSEVFLFGNFVFLFFDK